MKGWRPASVRPRNGQRVCVVFASKWLIPQFGMFNAGWLFRPHLNSIQWEDVLKWMPSTEIDREARTAGKVKR